MVPQGSVRVLGQPPFHATALTSSGVLSYVGGSWDRDIAFAGYSIPLQVRHANGSFWLPGTLLNVSASHLSFCLAVGHSPVKPKAHISSAI